jgi:hypothetical protein|tara:strand:+ start:108 stop:353 length:246 start_codon:yes stop_codon:yes gene_type:complete
MNYKKILEHLCEIECELDDAYYSLPDYNANSDSQSYIDGARCTLYHLKDEIERKILDDKKDHDVLYNKEAGDGEGRLKGNN